MDFLERWFGLSPDAGDGSFELVLIAFAMLVLGAVVGARLRRRQGLPASVLRKDASGDDATHSDGIAPIGVGHVRDQRRSAL